MAWGHFEQSYVYNYDINAVLDAVMRAASQNKLKLKKADRQNYRVQFSTGMSLLTWGEVVDVALGVLPDGKCGRMLDENAVPYFKDSSNLPEFIRTEAMELLLHPS